MARLLILIFVVASSASCSTKFGEKYYVGVYNPPQPGDSDRSFGPTQFYRFQLDGWTTLGSNTRYEAGWYDASVVDRLFGQIRPKEDRRDTVTTAEANTVSDIPLLYAGGEIERTGGAAAPTLRGTNIRLSFHSEPPTIELQHLKQLTADSITVTVKKGADGKLATESIACQGSATIMLADDQIPAALTKALFADATARDLRSYVHCEGLKSLNASGGTVSINSGDAHPVETSRRVWKGKTRQAATSSAYHRFKWSGGEFELSDGTISTTIEGIKAQGSFGNFHATDAEKLTLDALDGWLLQLRAATLDQVKDVSIRVTECAEAKRTVSPSGGGALPLPDKIKFSNAEQQTHFAAELEQMDNGASKSIPLSNATIYFDGTQLQLEKNGAVDTTRVTSFSVASMNVTEGSFGISTTQAAETAMSNGHRVQFNDSRRRILVHFGPEAEGSTQREDERFVIFMNSSPRDLVNRIRALVNSERTQNVIATALIAPRRVEDKLASEEVDTKLASMKKLSTDASAFVSADGFAETNKDQLKSKVLEWVSMQSGGNAATLLPLLQSMGSNNSQGKGGTP